MNEKNHEFKLAYNCRVTQDNSIMSSHYERWMSVYDFETDESLLDSGHFNSILYGECETNKNFNKCSQLSQIDSYTEPSCIEEKHECESQNVLGRSKQREIERIQEQITHANNTADGVRKMIEYLKKKPNNGNATDRPIDIAMGGVGGGIGIGFGAAAGTNTEMHSNNPEAFFSTTLDYINKQIGSLKEKLRRVESWPDP